MFLRRAFLLLLVAFAAPALAKPPEPPVKRGGLDFLQGLLGLHMDEKPPRAPELKIIGAGLSKTGTKTLHTVMEMLGHKVYDVQTVVRERHQQLMYDLFGRMGALKGRFPTANQTHGGPERERALDALYDAILETGSTAVFDNPFPVITEELLQRSPNAKVILSLRPFPGKGATPEEAAENERMGWIKSLVRTLTSLSALAGKPFDFVLDFEFIRTIYSFWTTRKFEVHRVEPAWAPWLNYSYKVGWFGDSLEDVSHFYDEHRQYIIDHVPADKLLVYRVSEGWAPLCKFLEITPDDCPEGDLPATNSAAELAIVAKLTKFIAITYPLFVIGFLVFAWWLIKRILRCCGAAGGASGKDKDA